MNKRVRTMRSLFPAILAAIVLGLLAFSAHATTSDTFRCPNGSLIHVNDKVSTVSMKCDPPTSVSRRTVAGVSTGHLGGTGYLYSGYYPVEIEEWVYNLGPASFMMYLTFTNGLLTRIESGDYGY